MAYTDHIVVDGVQYDLRDKEAVSFAQEQTLTETQQEQARENIGAGSEADVVDLKSQINQIDNSIFETAYPGTKINDIDNVIALSGMSASAGNSAIAIQSNDGFDTYYFITTNDIDLWVESIASVYFAIVVGGDYQSTTTSENEILIFCDGTKARYRNIDNNLPTSSNKLHIAAGCPVAFTVTKNGLETVFGVEIKTTVVDSFKNEIVPAKYLQYISGSGADLSTEKICVYIPNGYNGYVRYDFLHTVSAARNADIWRVGYAYFVDSDLNELYPITTSGEWECAIKLEGRSDFSGGYFHGDEVLTNVVFIVDGSPVTVSDYTQLTPFNTLSIFETSNLYDPDDSSTIFANHGSEHRFDDNGVTISQSVKFLSAVTVVSAYMAMFPIAKAVSDTVIPNNSFEAMSSNSIGITDTDSVTIYKANGGKVKAVFAVPIFEAFHSGKYAFWCLDNGTTQYNKCYYVNASSAVSITANKIFKSETLYQISASE